MVLTGTFKEYLEEAIGKDNARVAFSAFGMSPSVSVRINPFKKCHAYEGKQVPWSRHGIILPDRPLFTLDPHFHAGSYYVQDSSSMFVGHVFRSILDSGLFSSGRPLRVLDLCAAPGGKTTDLAASLREYAGDNFILVSNEVMKSRAGVLAGNVALWGDPNVAVTSDDPRAFAALPGYFDVIVADVPCSGEGMFRKDMQAVEQWSEDNVALCQARQRRIIADVWPALAPGGILVYSTCTFNRMENDLNVDWICSSLGAECVYGEYVNDSFTGLIRTLRGCSLVPGFVDGEGQYCSVVSKNGSPDGMREGRKGKGGRRKAGPLHDGLGRFVNVPCAFRERGTAVIAVPLSVSDEVDILGESLHVIAAGCAVGIFKGGILVPDADLALSLVFSKDAFPQAEVDREVALSYLHRDAISLPDADRGYVTVTYEGQPLGFVKNLGSRCNNLFPQGRRIRMDIKL